MIFIPRIVNLEEGRNDLDETGETFGNFIRSANPPSKLCGLLNVSRETMDVVFEQELRSTDVCVGENSQQLVESVRARGSSNLNDDSFWQTAISSMQRADSKESDEKSDPDLLASLLVRQSDEAVQSTYVLPSLEEVAAAYVEASEAARAKAEEVQQQLRQELREVHPRTPRPVVALSPLSRLCSHVLAARSRRGFISN